jgi:hypothetical protein
MDDVDVGKPRLPWTVAGDGVGRRRSAAVVGRPGEGGGRGRGGGGQHDGGVRAHRRHGGGVRAAAAPAACERGQGVGRARRGRRDDAGVEKQKGRRSPALVIRITLVG